MSAMGLYDVCYNGVCACYKCELRGKTCKPCLDCSGDTQKEVNDKNSPNYNEYGVGYETDKTECPIYLEEKNKKERQQ